MPQPSMNARHATELVPYQLLSQIGLASEFIRRSPRNVLARGASLTEAPLRRHRDIAGPATEIGAVLGLQGLVASRNKINGWRISAFEVRQTGYAGVAALWAA
jgi:hypothetical protein